MALNYVYIRCSVNSSFSLIIYFNKDNIAQEFLAQKIYTDSLRNGSNSLRVHEWLK